MKQKRFGCLCCGMLIMLFMFMPEGLAGYEQTSGNGESVPRVLTGKPGETLSVKIAYQFNAIKVRTDDIDDLTGNFVQFITEYIPWLRVKVDDKTAYKEDGSSTTTPINPVTSGIFDIIQYDTKTKSSYNRGYAAFNITLKSDIEEGNYYIPIYYEGEEYRRDENGNYVSIAINDVYRLPIVVSSLPTPTNSGGGGGGGGGGGSGVEAALPQAKLIIEGVDTNPKEPKAGEAFEINLKLRNTSEDLYLQNIKLSYEAEEDAVLPVSGAANLYIPKIEKGATLDVVLKVRAKPDLEDKPVKIAVTMEFEDSKVNALSESQTIILNIIQPQRVTFDNPVYPTGAVYPGESYEFTINVYNLGKPILYNLRARVVSDDPNLIPGQAYYGGNVEPASSKVCELEVTAMEAGVYSPTLEITYETINGKQEITKKALNIYVEPEIPAVIDDSDLPPEPTPEPDSMALTIMKALPWWIYAFLAGLLTVIIVSMGIGARRRKTRAFLEDEMD